MSGTTGYVTLESKTTACQEWQDRVVMLIYT